MQNVILDVDSFLDVNINMMSIKLQNIPVLITGHFSSFSFLFHDRSVTDPRDGKRVALKKMPHVFQNLISCKRVYRELKMLFYFNHDNVSKPTAVYRAIPWCNAQEVNPI